MKTLHVLGSRQYGGAENCYVHLARRMAADGHPTIAVNRPGSMVAGMLPPGVRQIQVPLANKWDLLSVVQLRRLVREHRPEVVHTYMSRATRLMRVPRGMDTVHVARLGGFYRIDGYYRHADAWIGLTTKLCDYLRAAGLPAQRIFKIPNFVPPPVPASTDELRALRRDLHIEDDAVVLVSLGRFVEKKGFEELLQAMSALPRSIAGRRPYLLLGGDGPMNEKLRTLARELGVEDRVTFLGWVDRPDPYFQLADLVVFPSRHEPMGRILQEAWNYAKPVVCTRSEGPSEIAEDNVDVLFVPIGEPKALADRLQEALLAPPQVLAELGRQGKAKLERLYTEDAVVQAYEDVFHAVAALGRLK